MRDDEIPNTDHVARLCRYTTLNEEGCPGPAAFTLRESELYLSINWLEYFRYDTSEKAVEKISSVLRKKRTVKSSARIAVINIGEMKQKVYDETSDKRNLSVKHKPTKKDRSYGGVYNFRFDEELIPVLICQTTKEIHPACIPQEKAKKV